VLEKLRDEVAKLTTDAIESARPALKRLRSLIQESIGADGDWSAFEGQFAEVHPGFIEALLVHAPELSQAEVKVASLVRIGLNTKEMASLLNVTTRAVEKHRLNLRKKLGVEGATGLPEVLVALA
jgi:DNA-binding CsgD family transcriptional regulator